MVAKSYIILVHTNPMQLERLINKLNDGYSHFYVHIDKNTSIHPFQNLQRIPFITLLNKRISCIWGDYSLVQATVNCISQIIKDKRDGYTILLSGQDYPITNNESINTYLESNLEYNHIDVFPLDQLPKGHLNRLKRCKINLSHTRGHFITLPYFYSLNLRQKFSVVKFVLSYTIKNRKLTLLLASFKTLRQRKCAISSYFGGSQWWGFNYATLKKVHQFIISNKSYSLFFQDKHVPDEIFFQTIIMHLATCDPDIKVKKSLTYVNSSESGLLGSTLFQEIDFAKLKSQTIRDKLFARKFDIHKNEKILNMLDQSVTIPRPATLKRSLFAQ